MKLNKLRLGVASFAILPTVALLLWCAGCERAESEGNESSFDLISVSWGEGNTSWKIIGNNQSLFFFSCGCEPCTKVAIRLQPISRKVTLVSNLSSQKIIEFCRKTRFLGASYEDQHSKLMLRLGVLDCPKLLIAESSTQYRIVDFEEFSSSIKEEK